MSGQDAMTLAVLPPCAERPGQTLLEIGRRASGSNAELFGKT
jgi:hypothetical protein